jgi:hypothetical protein
MDVKDTVMCEEELDDCYFNPPTTMDNEFIGYRRVNRHIAETQAEISFKAGMSVVVEWMKENITWDWPNDELLFSSWLKERGL